MFTPEDLTTRVDFCIAEAKWLSDLTGIQNDLEAAVRVCNRIHRDAERFNLEPGVDILAMMEERALVAELVCAATVRLMRTLGTGVRSGIPAAWLDDLPANLRNAHSYFKSLRDKFIAHSVNPLEDNQVFAWVKGYGTSKARVTRVDAGPGRYLPGAGDAALLGKLASSLLARVNQEIGAESARLLAIAELLPIDEVCKRGTEELPIPQPAKDVGRGRDPFKA